MTEPSTEAMERERSIPHDELVAILMAAPDSDWARMPDLLDKQRQIVAMVRAGAPHDGDCTKVSHTCLRCLVEQYDKEAMFVGAAIRNLT
jgi:hypothetical protein